ncbi:MAG: polyprenyl synthetase family protein [Ignavibacteria bacterium]
MEDALNGCCHRNAAQLYACAMHDTMDNADTRRGLETIHKKWNDNVAILTGDHLIGLAYSYLIKTDSKNLKGIVDTFDGRNN